MRRMEGVAFILKATGTTTVERRVRGGSVAGTGVVVSGLFKGRQSEQGDWVYI